MNTRKGEPLTEADSLLERPAAGLRIDSVRIRGFRSLQDVFLRLDPNVTFLVGENNVGKTSILDAIAVATGARRPSADDLSQEVRDSVAIIDLLVAPSDGVDFPDETTQRFRTAPGRTHDGRVAVNIRTTLRRSEESAACVQDTSFTRVDDMEVPVTGYTSRVGELLECQFTEATRDLESQFRSRQSAWGRVVSDLQIPNEAPLKLDGTKADTKSRSQLEQDLNRIATDVRDASPVLALLESHLRGLVQALGSVEAVEIVALPQSIDELSQAMQVLLHQGDSVRLPLRFHGMGSRSLAVLLLHKTLAEIRVGRDRGIRPHQINLIEEPEAHLHPLAVVAAGKIINQIPGQTIVSTHSTHLVSDAPTSQIRMIKRHHSHHCITAVSADTAKKIAQFRKFIERPFGEIFFSSILVFVDGTTERNALPPLLEAPLGHSTERLGVFFIDTDSMRQEQLSKLTAAATELGLPWLVFADNDSAGVNAIEGIDSTRIVMAGRIAFEQLLLDAGYGDIVDFLMPEGPRPFEEKERLKFLSKNKSWVATEVVKQAVESGRSTPEPCKVLAEKILGELRISQAHELYIPTSGKSLREVRAYEE